jgi:GTP-binding protein
VKIRSLEFSGSVVSPEQERPSDLPQIAFSGRSNVGKSSLINTLLRRTRKKIAHVSGQPGKTQALNFYRVNDRFYLVDLPGFGYAKVPKALRNQWRPLIERYLAEEPRLLGVVHLIDIRHSPTPDDRQMIEYLADLGIPTLLVFTKVDKLPQSRRKRQISAMAEELQVDLEQILPFSAKTGEGREELLEALEGLLESESGEAGAGSDQGDEAEEPTEP